ncbi:MBL fold metallo-hydrolase [Paenibacillus oenotherae]|uniref:MBL fold metallo-hydrolase n=1 Tax=Paenibacillus oenotherae TaxID=1435645 RepID=A0ABS7DDE7_9BACL|nr:MBL fold metallo-hydrolase [Paenibacillus oenotherae]MBW7477748.1 MBL fold metallo-hydrolase [Paenibacillus oenotherae]
METIGLKGMTAGELTKKVLDNTELFILDVRNDSDYDDWKIEGATIESINVPYFHLIDGVDDVLDKIPDDKEVVVVCAKEGSSVFVAGQLVEQGKHHVSYLVGGMKAWSEHLEPVKVGDLQDGGSIYQFVRIGKGCLSYMVVSNGEAAVIDTLRMTEVFENFAKEQNAVIKHTLDTHLHADHISGGLKLAQHTGAKYWLPPKDADEVVFNYNQLDEHAEITVGNTKIHIQPVYSPGHTIGSTSLIVDNQYLLSGDILFVQSIGRPDLAGKAEDWVSDLRNTLYSRYKRLSEDLIVLPAHFGKATELGVGGKVSARLGDLFKENPGLNMEDEAEFRKAVTENLPPQPHAYQEIRQVNMGKITPTDEEQRDMETGPNRCAIHDK